MLPQYDDNTLRVRGPWRALRPPAEEWRERAACRGKPVDWWVPSHGPVGITLYTPDAARICAACPVRTECLDFAIEHQEHGYWGGTSERERVRIRWERRLDVERRAHGGMR